MGQIENLDIPMSKEELESLIVVYENKLSKYQAKVKQNNRYLQKHFENQVSILTKKVEYLKSKK